MNRSGANHAWISLGLTQSDRMDALRCSCGLLLYRLRLESASPRLKGRKMFYFSDTHIACGRSRSFFPSLSWRGTDLLNDILNEISSVYAPDILVFGGDLLRELAMFDVTFDTLSRLPRSMLKLAVSGNWDASHFPCHTHSFWENAYRRIGFHYLRNQSFRCSLDGGALPDCFFYGMDDWKLGRPVHPAPEHLSGDAAPYAFRCLLSHNPDAIPDCVPPDALRSYDLILCGHTHAGQIRVPGFGALKTSSCYGKRYEHGLYGRGDSDVLLWVSGGIGCTWLPLRVFCPPEALLVEWE